MSEHADVAIVGGGLGGLATAALLARRGRRCVVFERSSHLGGRGATHRIDGFAMNQGGHALYRGGAAMRILAELGIRVPGKPPPVGRGAILADGELHLLPTGLSTMIRTGLVGAGGKIELARLLTRLPKIDLGPLEGVPLLAWLKDSIRNPRVRATVETLVRLSTYANAPGLVSTGAALRQLRLASSPGVLYVDGGWQTLVDGLGRVLRESDSRVETSATVTEVRASGHRWRVALAGGAAWRVDAVVLAVGPRAAASLVTEAAGSTLRAWAADCVPARAACLDVGLRFLPMPERTFALGLDAPLYFSVHSVAAEVAPEGQALVHAMKYLAPDDSGSAEDHARELECWLDVCQPGWREAVVAKRYLPHVIATHDMVRAGTGGVRPGPCIPRTPGLLVVGDWVGAEGMLADASFASAENAVRAISDDDARIRLEATG